MSAFDFFFSLYGLILGLSVVTVVTGFARVVKERRRVRMGYVTPLLGVLVLVDLTSFWRNAWDSLRGIQISLAMLLAGLLVAAIYFLAASLVFPDDLKEWPSLDDFYEQHKRWVAGGVVAANVIAGFGLSAFVFTPTEWLASVGRHGPMAAAYICLMAAVMLVKDRRINAVLMLAVLALYVHR